MEQANKENTEKDFAEDRIYEMPEAAFKFNYPGPKQSFAERLVDELNNNGGKINDGSTRKP